MASVAAKPFVDGFLVRIGWADVEPSPGVFDWTLLDQQLAMIGQAGKKAALAIVQGRGTPTWIGSVGAATHTWNFRGSLTTVAVPWDTVYLQRWTALVTAVGARYDSDPTVSLVHATHATQNGFEMQLPISEQQAYQALGYTDSVYAQSWQSVLDAFLQAFPSKPIDLDVHPIWGSDAVAAQVVVHGLAVAPDRFGAFGGWWSVHNATQAYPGMQAIFEGTAEQSFTNVQNVGSFITTPTRYGSDVAEYRAAFDTGLATGIRYFEVWNADLLDSTLDSLHAEIRAAVHCDGWYQLYPDPASLPAVAHRIVGCPAPLSQFSFTIDGASAGSTAAALLIGSSRTTIPVLDQTLLVGPTTTLWSVPISLDGSGHGALTVTMPATGFPSLTTQGGVLDPGTGSGLVLTNAIELR